MGEERQGDVGVEKVHAVLPVSGAKPTTVLSAPTAAVVPAALIEGEE
jgi:hypothetical protein